MLGQRIQFERPRRIDDSRVLRQAGQDNRLRACRDDALLESQRFAIV